MRKTSQDGGDSTSITSGFEIDLKRPGIGLIKTKKTSIKRKVQNFSHESDDGVIEPLLQKDKERPESGNQSAKFMLSKTKTDSISEGDEKDKLLGDTKSEMPSMTCVPGIKNNQALVNGLYDSQIVISYPSSAHIHNHMNTNVTKSQILVEIDKNKQKSYNSSPLIFTTAKIHTDGKTKPMEPVHVMPMPILSTIEGSIVKAGSTVENLRDKNIPTIFKNDNTTSNIGIQSSTNDRLTSSTDRASSVNYSTSSASHTGVYQEDISECKFPNITNKTTSTTSTYKSFDSKSIDAKSNKPPYFQDNIKCSVVATTTKENEDKYLKDQASSKTMLPQTSYSTISALKKPATDDQDSTQCSSITKPTFTSNASGNDKVTSPMVSSFSGEIEVDVNKNIQSIPSTAPQQPGFTEIIISTATKVTTENSKQDRAISCPNNSVSSKQLPRQKNVVSKDSKILNISIAGTKQYNIGNVNNKVMEVKSNVKGDTQVEKNKSEHPYVKNIVTSPKSSANNIPISNAAITSLNSSVALSTTGKTSVHSSASLISATTSEYTFTKPVLDEKSVIATSTANAKSSSVSTIKPLSNASNSTPITSKSISALATVNMTTPSTSSFSVTITKPSSITTSSLKLGSTADTSKSSTVNKTNGVSKLDPTVATIGAPKLVTAVSISKPGTTLASTSTSKPGTISTAISIPQPVNTVATTFSGSKPITTSIATNAGKTVSKTNTKAIPNSTQSYVKTSTTSVKPPAVTTSAVPNLVKPSVVTSIKATTAETSAQKTIITKAGSNTTPLQTKTSTATAIKTSVTKTPNATKLPSSKSVTTAHGSSVTSKISINKQSDTKSNDRSKDDKSKA